MKRLENFISDSFAETRDSLNPVIRGHRHRQGGESIDRTANSADPTKPATDRCQCAVIDTMAEAIKDLQQRLCASIFQPAFGFVSNFFGHDRVCAAMEQSDGRPGVTGRDEPGQPPG